MSGARRRVPGVLHDAEHRPNGILRHLPEINVTMPVKYLRKGSQAYIEGQIESRSWEKDGQKHYATEVVLRPFNSELLLLDKGGAARSTAPRSGASAEQNQVDADDRVIPVVAVETLSGQPSISKRQCEATPPKVGI